MILRDVRWRVRDALRKAGLDAAGVDEMDVAVGEVLSNVYRHAYRGDFGPVEIRVFRGTRAISVVVADHGDTRAAPALPKTPPPPTQADGRGLYLAQQLSDAIRVRVLTNGGLAVRITKQLRSPTIASNASVPTKN